MLGEKVVCATASPHLYILLHMYTSEVLPITLWQLHSVSVTELNCHVMKMTTA